MKKFFGKLPVMISLWVVTAALLVITIVMAVRPVSMGWAYKSKERDIMGLGEKQEITIVFDDDNEYKMKLDLEGLYFEMDMWYLIDGNEYVTLGVSSMPPLVESAMGGDLISAKEFNDKVTEMKHNSDLRRTIWAESENINAFKCKFNGEEFICAGAIAFTVIFSTLTVIALVASIMSTVLFVNKKNSKVVESLNVTQSQPVEEKVQTDKVEGQLEIQDIE